MINKNHFLSFRDELRSASNVGPEQFLPKLLAGPRLIRLHEGEIIKALRSFTTRVQVFVLPRMVSKSRFISGILPSTASRAALGLSWTTFSLTLASNASTRNETVQWSAANWVVHQVEFEINTPVPCSTVSLRVTAEGVALSRACRKHFRSVRHLTRPGICGSPSPD